MDRSQRRLALLASHLSPEEVSRDACGIIAVIGGSAPASDYIMEGLTILQVRVARFGAGFLDFFLFFSLFRTVAMTRRVW